jgi:hypothetical protein
LHLSQTTSLEIQNFLMQMTQKVSDRTFQILDFGIMDAQPMEHMCAHTLTYSHLSPWYKRSSLRSREKGIQKNTRGNAKISTFLQRLKLLHLIKSTALRISMLKKVKGT